jgi:hypothetical protein
MPTRREAVAEARSWIGTPYRESWVLKESGRVLYRRKGRGVDCAGLLAGVFDELGIVDFEPGDYSTAFDPESPAYPPDMLRNGLARSL